MSDLSELAVKLGGDVVAEVKASLGEDYASLTDEQKASIARTGVALMELQLRAKAGEDVALKLEAVESTVQDWKVWGEISADVAFWKGVQKVAQTFGSFLAGAAGKFLGL